MLPRQDSTAGLGLKVQGLWETCRRLPATWKAEAGPHELTVLSLVTRLPLLEEPNLEARLND